MTWQFGLVKQAVNAAREYGVELGADGSATTGYEFSVIEAHVEKACEVLRTIAAIGGHAARKVYFYPKAIPRSEDSPKARWARTLQIAEGPE